MSKPLPVRTLKKVLRQRQAVALYLRGVAQYEIASKLGVTETTVCADIAKARDMWAGQLAQQGRVLLGKELAKIDEMEREAWDAWEKSKLDKTWRRSKRGQRGEESEVRLEASCGNVEWLRVVQWCVAKRCELLGLDAPVRLQVTGDGGGPVQVQAVDTRPEQVDRREVLALIEKAKARQALTEGARMIETPAQPTPPAGPEIVIPAPPGGG